MSVIKHSYFLLNYLLNKKYIIITFFITEFLIIFIIEIINILINLLLSN